MNCFANAVKKGKREAVMINEDGVASRSTTESRIDEINTKGTITQGPTGRLWRLAIERGNRNCRRAGKHREEGKERIRGEMVP